GGLGEDPGVTTHLGPVGDRVESHRPHFAGVRRQEPVEETDGGGLAGAVVAEQTHDLAVLHPEPHVVESGDVTEAAGHPAHVQCGVSHVNRTTGASRASLDDATLWAIRRVAN